MATICRNRLMLLSLGCEKEKQINMIHITLFDQDASRVSRRTDICAKTIEEVKRKITEYVKGNGGEGFYRTEIINTHGNYCRNCGEPISSTSLNDCVRRELSRFWEDEESRIYG